MILLTIVGFGNVGSTLCYALLNDEAHTYVINVMDPSSEVRGAFLDLQHAAVSTPHRLMLNNSALFNQSSFVFHCAGPSVAKGASRLSITEASVRMTHQIFESYQPISSAYVIVLSNPVDIISEFTQSISKLPDGRVVGVGTMLDTLRLKHLLSEATGVIAREIETIVIGEHGASAVWLKSHTFIGGRPLSMWLSDEQQQVIEDKLLNSAAEIKKTQGATYYGVAKCAREIMEGILRGGIDEPVSVMLSKPYQLAFKTESVFIGFPVDIYDGIVAHSTISMTDHERKLLEESVKLIADAGRVT